MSQRVRRILCNTGVVVHWLGLGLHGVPAVAAPSLSVQPAQVEVGKIKAGEVRTLRFRLKNTSRRKLKIRSIEGDCGCLTAQYPPTLGPGASAEIKAQFEPQPLWSGAIRRHLIIRTDDAAQSRIQLPITADIIPFIRFAPHSRVLVPYEPGKRYRRVLQLVPRAGSGIKIRGVKSDSPLVKAVLSPPAAGDKARTHRLHLTVGPRGEPGDFTATVYLTTTVPGAEAWPVTVVGVAKQGPVVSPRRVLLPVVRAATPGKELTRLQVLTRSGQLQVLSVETGTAKLRAEIVTRTPGRLYNVILRPAAALPAGTLTTTLRIRTNDPKHPVITVPFHATLR